MSHSSQRGSRSHTRRSRKNRKTPDSSSSGSSSTSRSRSRSPHRHGKERASRSSSATGSSSRRPRRSCSFDSSNPSAGWMLSKKIKKKIFAGDYVDFDTILTEVASKRSRVPVSEKSSDARARKRVVRDIGSWLQAWSAFAATLLETDPSRGHELLGYQAIIAQANADYQPSAWLQYDSSFRLLASRHQSLRWDAIHNHLWAQCFTGRAVSTVTCFSCGRPGHIASDCKSSNNSFRAPTSPTRQFQARPPVVRANSTSAVSLTAANAAIKQHHISANTAMNASPAKAITQRCPVPARAPISQHRADIPLQPEQFSCLLRNHPNRTFVNSLITSLTHGFDIGYSGTRTLRISPNLKSAFEHKDIVQQSLDTECERGHMAGPYEVLPMSNLVFRLGRGPKKNGSWRLIMHLSAPLGLSINDGIDPDDYHLRYKKIDYAIAMIRELGPGCSTAKIDLKHAFRLCPVRRQDWDL